jgi:signal-transduction protein with cAMP-binding, CBS, and nucleotidyltransferase domain
MLDHLRLCRTVHYDNASDIIVLLISGAVEVELDLACDSTPGDVIDRLENGGFFHFFSVLWLLPEGRTLIVIF